MYHDITFPFLGHVTTMDIGNGTRRILVDLSEGNNKRAWDLYQVWLKMTGPVIYRDSTGYHACERVVFTERPDVLDIELSALTADAIDFYHAQEIQDHQEQQCQRYSYTSVKSSYQTTRITVSESVMRPMQTIRVLKHQAELLKHCNARVQIHPSLIPDVIHSYHLDPTTCLSTAGSYKEVDQSMRLVISLESVLDKISQGETSGVVCYIRGIKGLTPEQESNHQIRDVSDYVKSQILNTLLQSTKQIPTLGGWITYDINQDNYLTWELVD